MTPVDEALRHLVRRHGPVPFDQVVAMALYAPDGGFYASGGQAGRRGDFLTSPEVGPLFGAVVARALDGWWAALGRPPVFSVVEAGAGPGSLARAVLAARPDCTEALRYVLVEVSAGQRARHAERLPIEPAAWAFTGADEDEEEPAVTPPPGPIVVSLAELPRLPGPCVVIANELLDNLPFRLLERTETDWVEVRVGLHGDRLTEVHVPIVGSAPAVDAPVGARVPVQDAATEWVRTAVDLAGPGGRVVAFDYTSTTGELAIRPWTEWVRTYRSHARGGHPLEHLGEQDITCEVAIDQLPAPARTATQAEWLRDHGIDELVQEGRATWRDRASIGDLAAVRARSRVTEAEALLDPNGLGRFRVLEWDGAG